MSRGSLASSPRVRSAKAAAARLFTATFAAICLLLAAHACEAATKGRVALIIANDAYGSNRPPLAFAAADAERFKGLAEAHGFSILGGAVASNRDRNDLNAAFKKFEDLSPGECDVGLIYYSGHGVGQKQDNQIVTSNEEFASVERLVDSYVATACARVVVILDMCRTPPAASTPADAREQRRNVLIVFATSEGGVAQVNSSKGLSYFTRFLAEEIEARPRQDIKDAVRSVARSLKKLPDTPANELRYVQEPGFEGSVDFAFDESEDAPKGFFFSIGGSFGYAYPWGRLAARYLDAQISVTGDYASVLRHSLVFGGDASVRFAGERVTLGVYGLVGVLNLGNSAKSLDGAVMYGVGGMALYHFLSRSDPWNLYGGAAVGAEIIRATEPGVAEIQLRGLSVFPLVLGFDHAVTTKRHTRLRTGVRSALGFGTVFDAVVTSPSYEHSGGIGPRAYHYWFMTSFHASVDLIP